MLLPPLHSLKGKKKVKEVFVKIVLFSRTHIFIFDDSLTFVMKKITL